MFVFMKIKKIMTSKSNKSKPTWVKVAKKIIEDKKKVHEVIMNGGDIKKIKGIQFVKPSEISENKK